MGTGLNMDMFFGPEKHEQESPEIKRRILKAIKGGCYRFPYTKFNIQFFKHLGTIGAIHSFSTRSSIHKMLMGSPSPGGPDFIDIIPELSHPVFTGALSECVSQDAIQVSDMKEIKKTGVYTIKKQDDNEHLKAPDAEKDAFFEPRRSIRDRILGVLRPIVGGALVPRDKEKAILDTMRLKTVEKTTEKPVEEFKVGKWYRWVGPKVEDERWDGPDGKMACILDGLPHRCIKAIGTMANFDGIELKDFYQYAWDWFKDGMQNFREVPDPTIGLGASIVADSFITDHGPSKSDSIDIIDREQVRKNILG